MLGINVLLVSQTLFFVQGLAVASWFVRQPAAAAGVARCSVPRGRVWGRCSPAHGLVGLFDTWLDYRKRFALKGPGAGSARETLTRSELWR